MSSEVPIPEPLHGASAEQALTQGSFASARAPEDLIILEGSDTTDFLHRISASEVRDLGPASAKTLIFTDDKGHLIAAPLAWREGETWVLACGPGCGERLEAWIRKWIITENILLSRGDSAAVIALSLDPSDEHSVLDALGLSGAAEGARVVAGNGAVLVRPHSRAFGPSILIPSAVEQVLMLMQHLPLVDGAAARAAAVQAGRVECGPALIKQPNPLELGWRELIAFDKGCYIGQEVIAKLDTHNKVRRALAFVRFSSRAGAGWELKAGNKEVGYILDTHHEHEKTLALALVDRKLENGAKLKTINDEAGTLEWIPASNQD